MFNRNKVARVRWLKGIAVIFCLAPMLVSQTRAVPTLLAAAAMLEGSHTVLVAGAEGETRVVLSHQRGNADRADVNPRHRPTDPSHRHGLASNLLCVFAKTASGEADHVARFATISNSGIVRCTLITMPKLAMNLLVAAGNIEPRWNHLLLSQVLEPSISQFSSAVLLGISTALLI